MARAVSAPVDHLLAQLWERGATDLLLTAGARPLLRVDGEMESLDDEAVLLPDALEGLAKKMLTPEQWVQFLKGKELDFSFTWRDTSRFRVNVFLQRGSTALALRSIPYAIPTFEELGLPDVCRRFVGLPQGLVLVTGPTGSGKSTTLASMIDRINTDRACHILTIEDPIEYVHRHKRSAVNQREVGEDTDSFPRALRSALREDPDVLLVGEMRDLESIQIALTIAETGHLVFATLHTNDTSQAIDRIVDVFPGDRQDQIRIQLANSLAGIVHQRLLPRVGGGRVAAFEVLVATTPVRNLIREGKANQLRNVISMQHAEGMQTLEKALSRMVAEGTVELETAQRVSLYPRDLEHGSSEPSAAPARKGLRR